MSIEDKLRSRLGEEPAPAVVTAEVRALAGSTKRPSRSGDQQRCAALLPLAVRCGDPGALFYLARWLRKRPALTEQAMGTLEELVPQHPDAARLLVSNLLLGESAIRAEVQGCLERWPTGGAHDHVATNHGPNEAVAAQLDSKDPEQIVAGLVRAPDSCSSLPTFGAEIFVPFNGAEIPQPAQLSFIELICKYHRFDPPPADEARCEALVDFALTHASANALMEISAWLRTSEQHWIDHALVFIGRRRLGDAREVRAARQLLAALVGGNSPVASRTLRLLDLWPLDDPRLGEVIRSLAAELALEATRVGNVGWLERLLAYRPQLDRTFDDEGFNALHLAVQQGRPDLVQLLLDGGIDPEVPTACSTRGPDRGRRALELAALVCDSETVGVLLEAGVVTATNEEEAAALLRLAAGGGAAELVRRLVDEGAAPDGGSTKKARARGVAPLHDAAAAGHLEAVRVLLEAGANLDAPSELGKTALHYAAEEGHLALVQLLLARGADPLVRNADGELAGDVARTTALQREIGAVANQRGGDPVGAWLRQAVAFYRQLGLFARYGEASDEEVIAELHEAHGPLSSGVADADLGLLVLDSQRVWVADYYGPDVSTPVTRGAGRYQEALAALSRIARPRVSLTKIEERWSGPRGPIKVSYWLGGRQYVVQPEYLGDYFDVGFLTQVNRSLVTAGQRFALYRARYMELWGACIMILTEAEQRRIEQERGCRFYTAEELDAERDTLRELAAEDDLL